MKRNQRQTIRTRLCAGIRCHNRFYSVLTRDVKLASQNGIYSDRLSLLFGDLIPADILKRAGSVNLAFEVNLGQRRPDCVCTINLEHESMGLCILIELKTCRFSKNMNTASKTTQQRGGLKQLNDSVSLITKILPPGDGKVVLIPLLVFIAQRGMNILKVTSLPHKQLSSNIKTLAANLTKLAEYIPKPAKPVKGSNNRNKSLKQKVNCLKCNFVNCICIKTSNVEFINLTNTEKSTTCSNFESSTLLNPVKLISSLFNKD
ncbi:nuclear protein UL24 [Canid alphaherpesvirus 1]|uniref:Protein UL24 homolog n=1 Tax=Canid alphaherpesvirus 1 TaxID=170325 RepID=Q91SC7_9ALPH|nr:nuclear protein UL24 [Canid alphaherpesvirus 1]AAX18922.1 UL24 [Cloning vector pCMH500]AAK51055.1 UL24 [Canid alphaherpesvirus 1]ALL25911.1 nuclear protein UL24 [Canid alphaherpesvirus 1]ALL25992.1 nuclear protein UL24 [Canid alphaherpesvirus 1]ALL26067.1 nuclear protein UL24 [Canid alphaherpesvirus 1]